MMLVKASMAMIKIKGDSGSPCGTPSSLLNSEVGDPLTNTADLVQDKIPLIHLSQVPGKPICCIMEMMKSQFNESKAFSKSILKQKASILRFFNQARISFNMRGPSSIFLSDRKAVWVGEMILLITFFNRLARTLEMTFLIQPIRVIGRKSLSDLAEVFLGIKVIKDELHPWLMVPEW